MEKTKIEISGHGNCKSVDKMVESVHSAFRSQPEQKNNGHLRSPIPSPIAGLTREKKKFRLLGIALGELARLMKAIFLTVEMKEWLRETSESTLLIYPATSPGHAQLP